MIRAYIPYWEWEDWVNGMWAKGDDSLLQKAIAFTGDWERYGQAMKEVIVAWPRTMLNSLTNTSINPRAFIGHCAVCFKLGIPESTTRAAWKLLTNEQRYEADKIAQEIVDKWRSDYEIKNRAVHSNMAK